MTSSTKNNDKGNISNEIPRNKEINKKDRSRKNNLTNKRSQKPKTKNDIFSNQIHIQRTVLNHSSYPETNSDNFQLSEDYLYTNEVELNIDCKDFDNESLKINGTDGLKIETYNLNSSKLDNNQNNFESLDSELKHQLEKCLSKLSPQYRSKVNLTKQNADGNLNDEVKTKTITKMETENTTHKKENTKHQKNYTYISAEDSIDLLNKRDHILISIDNEFYERSTSKVTEIGICIYNPRYQRFALFPHFLNIHFIIKEFINLRNGLFVPDSKMNNITGQSILISKNDIPKAMEMIFQVLGPKTCIVGHNIKGDIQSFKNLDYEIPDNFKIIDTTILWFSLIGSSYTKSSLTYILDTLNIPNAFLHNGANDAYYTLVVCLMLASTELRNNLIFKKKNSMDSDVSAEENPQQISEASDCDTSSTESNVEEKQPPDFSQFPPEVADIKMKRWLRKKKKADEKAMKNKKDNDANNKNVFDTLRIRCSMDETTILTKHGGMSIRKMKSKNPPSNKFFKPTDYEENKLSQKLFELNI